MVKKNEKRSNGHAVAAFVLGIVAFVFGWSGGFGLVLGILAVVFGIISLTRHQNKAFGLVGIIGGGLAFLTSLIIVFIAIATTVLLPKSAAPAPTVQTPAATQETQTPVKPETPSVISYKTGTYKVGSDMPAGEYRLIAASGAGYFKIASDSTGSFDSIVSNDNFSTNSIVTIEAGQYFEITRATAYPIDTSPSVDTSKEGMFKVGKDITAGEYKLTSDGSGYLMVSSDSTHGFGSIVTNDNFEGDQYITVSDGQYLTLSRAHIVK